MSHKFILSVWIFAACTGKGEISVQYTPRLSEIGDCLQLSQGTRYTISGSLKYEQPQFKNASLYLDLANPTVIQKPIRQALVQVIDPAADRVLAIGLSDNSGNYSLSYNEPESALIKVRVLSRIYANDINPRFRSSNSCGLFLSVSDNTSAGALYAVGSGQIAKSSPTFSLTVAHNGASRSAGVFSILDSALTAAETILIAKNDMIFQPLNLYWSVNNTTASGNIRTGLIGTSFFGQDIFAEPGRAAIYLLGAAGIDTDEFDPNVIIHEFGHYLEYFFYRTDSIGGAHGPASRLDLSLAFSEAWGNFFGAAVRQNSLYFDSSGANNASGMNIQLENQPGDNIYNETSIQAALWDIYDGANDDAANCGLKPISDAFSATRVTSGLMSYLHFSSALAGLNPTCLNGALTTLNSALGAGTISDAFTMTNVPAAACRTQLYQGPFTPVFSDSGTLKPDFNSDGVNNYCAVKWYRVTGNGSTRTANLTAITGACNLDFDISENGTSVGYAGNAGNGGSESLSGISFKNGVTYIIRVRTVSVLAGTTSCSYTLNLS